MGGYNKGYGQKVVYQYDVYAGSVVQTINGPAMPYTSWFAATAQHHNDIYVLGGRSDSPGVDWSIRNVIRFKPGLWDPTDTLPKMNLHREQGCAFVINDRLYVTGGIIAAGMESLNLVGQDSVWETEAVSHPMSSHGAATAVIDDIAYMTDGQYLMKWQVGEDSWSFMPNMTESHVYHCMVSDGESRLWVFGGYNTLTAEMFSVTSGQWTMVDSIPHYERQLSGHGCVYHDGHVYVVGGTGYTFYSNQIHVFDTETGTWRESSNMGVGLTDMAVGMHVWG